MSVDAHAETVAHMDPRLRVAGDNPECFVCGKRIRRANAVYVESGASPRMPAHSTCCDGMAALDLMARYWQAIRAAVEGHAETPNPCAPVVRGRFA